MSETLTKGRRIQVANARPEDSGTGLARIPAAVMQELGLTEGDVVEIIGKRSTPSRAVLSYREDEGLDLLRLDGLQRANAGVGSGDFVEIAKGETRVAQRVVLAPMTMSAECRRRSTSCVRWSNCRSAIPSCSSV